MLKNSDTKTYEEYHPTFLFIYRLEVLGWFTIFFGIKLKLALERLGDCGCGYAVTES
jgi:prolipoprotein diacylglyceryltransferase